MVRLPSKILSPERGSVTRGNFLKRKTFGTSGGSLAVFSGMETELFLVRRNLCKSHDDSGAGFRPAWFSSEKRRPLAGKMPARLLLQKISRRIAAAMGQRVAQASRLRVAAASRRQRQRAPGRCLNPQPRTAALHGQDDWHSTENSGEPSGGACKMRTCCGSQTRAPAGPAGSRSQCRPKNRKQPPYENEY